MGEPVISENGRYLRTSRGKHNNMEFAQKTIENIKEDLFKTEFENHVHFAPFFLGLAKKYQQAWMDDLRGRITDPNTSLYEKMKSTVLLQHYQSLLSQ